MNFSIDTLKKLREETQAGVADCRQALEDAGGDYAKAKKLISERGLEKAAKKEGKTTSEGLVEAYIHANGKIGAIIALQCETDFVARNDAFKALAHEVAMQVAAMDPKTVEELLKSAYIRDGKQTIADLIKLTIAKVGENITVAAFKRIVIGE